MIPPKFGYMKARSVDEALQMLSRHGEAKLIAGGQSLVPMLKLRLISPSHIIDMGGLDDLKYIRADESGTLRIGAMTTHAEIEESEVIEAGWPVLRETASEIADLQVRQRGTVGGSLSHADPAADYPPTLMALGADVVLRSPAGRRTVPVEGFFVGPFQTVLGPTEILEEVVVPPLNGRAAFVTFARRQGDFPLVNAAARIRVEDDVLADVAVAMGGVRPRPLRLSGLEASVIGKKFDASEFGRSISREVEDLDYPADVHGSAEYRKTLAGVLLGRLFRRVLEEQVT